MFLNLQLKKLIIGLLKTKPTMLLNELKVYIIIYTH